MTQINSIRPSSPLASQHVAATDLRTSEAQGLPGTEGLIVNQSVDVIAAQLGGNAEAYMAAIVLKFADERARNLRETRGRIELHISEVQAEQVEKLHEQADALRTGALWSAGLGALGGAATIGSGSLGLVESEGLSEVVNGETVGKAWAKVAEGSGDVLNALGDGAQGWYSKDAKDREADATAAGNRAGAAERQLDTVEDDLDSAQDLEQRALDFLDQASQTRAQTEQSVYIRG